MSKIMCYSVRLESLMPISDKAYKARAFNGSEAILPKSQVFAPDFSTQKSDAYWIAAWILKQKGLQYSSKKIGWFNTESKVVEGNVKITIEHHIPNKIIAQDTIADSELIK